MSTHTHAVGSVLAGGYQVIDIKQGGMGVVYICHQATTDQFYAVKTVLFGGGAEDQEREARFRDEVLNWIRLSARHPHPNIVQALLYNQDEKWLFLEFVDGLGVHETIPVGSAHLQHAVDWARGITLGMRVLHEDFSLLHRDLKPPNVLVRGVGLVPKVTDLGIGKILQEGTKGSTLIGTPGYMAPEAFDGVADFRSDVYSFGALLYRMITGTSPSKQAALLGRPVELPSSVNPLVPPELDDLVRHCLAPDSEQRLASFREVQSRLEGLPSFERDEYSEGFRRCEKHGFYSPVADGLPACLFCARMEQQLELFETARLVTSARGNGPVPYDPNEPTLTSSAGQTVTSPGGRGVQFISAPQHTVTARLASADGGRADSQVHSATHRSRRSRWPLVAIVAVMLVGVFLWWRPWGASEARRSRPTPTNGAGVAISNERIEDGVMTHCGAEGCENEFEQQTIQHSGKLHAQRFCDRHFVCGICGMRYETRAESSQPCTTCGSPALRPSSSLEIPR